MINDIKSKIFFMKNLSISSVFCSSCLEFIHLFSLFEILSKDFASSSKLGTFLSFKLDLHNIGPTGIFFPSMILSGTCTLFLSLQISLYGGPLEKQPN